MNSDTCPRCKKRKKFNKSGYCRECKLIKGKEWYEKNKETYKKQVLNKLKETNYAIEKTEKAREIRRIKQKTRNHFPIRSTSICEVCGNLATERHHWSDPIQYDKFIYVCHDCHIEADKIKRGLRNADGKRK